MTAKKSRPKKKPTSVITLGVLAKSLASNELKTREYSQRDAKTVLTKTGVIDEGNLGYDDILGICKGLHYSLWMQDKLIKKEEVVARICDILVDITSENTCCYYFQAVFETLAREWDKMDKWQEDKFMLLCRDFFTRGLHYFPVNNPKLWHAFISAVFDKILNADVYHAVSLKMHMCSVLSEELARKKVKAVSIVSTLSKCVEQLVRLPKHNSYAHSMLRLIQNLQHIVRQHSAADLTQIIKQVDNICALKTPFGASVSRLAKFLHSLEKRNFKLHNASGLPSANQLHSSSVVTKTDPMVITDDRQNVNSSDHSIDSNFIEECSQSSSGDIKKRLKRRRDKIKEKKLKKKIKSICPPVTLPKELPECPMDLLCSDEPENVLSAISTPNDETISSPLPNPATIPDKPTEIVTPQRRVSFGKVYRKKFLSSRRLPLTPTLLSTPSKGILRDHGTNRQNRRVSL